MPRRELTRFILPSLLALLTLAMIKIGIDERNHQPTHAVIFVAHQSDLKFYPAAGLPKGAQVAIIRGDLTKAEPYTIRLKLPAGYVFPPHSHQRDESLTVIYGTLNVGMGDNVNKLQGQMLVAGAYEFIPANQHHYLWTLGDTVVQIDGMGPNQTVYSK